jgi:8-oxo-dGTP pyrophosphatase MutT (NUDIX family)
LSPINVVTALIEGADGRLLVVRKQGTQRFMLPGGKPEPGETPTQALARELAEELGCRLVEARAFGVFEAQAANEPGRRVRGHVHRVWIEGEVFPSAEIAELAWISPAAPHLPLAPLLEHHILPALRA